jgi:hypothetical protein
VDDSDVVHVPPVANSPFSATVSSNAYINIYNGAGPNPGTSSGAVARDGSGRVYMERYSPGRSSEEIACYSTDSFCGGVASYGQDSRLIDRIYIDPVQQTYYDCTVKDRLCHVLPYSLVTEQHVPGLLAATARTARPIGPKKIDGVEAVGISTILPRGKTETWYSRDLQIDLQKKRSMGNRTQIVQVEHLKRSEPSAKLFTLPTGYTITSAPLPPSQADLDRQALREKVLAAMMQKSH